MPSADAWVTGDAPLWLMTDGFSNMPDAKPAIKTATASPTTFFSEGDIFAFMASLGQID